MKISFLVCSLFLTSCATMFNSGSQSVRIMSTESESKMKVAIKTPDGAYDAVLPTTVVSSPSTFSKIEISVTDKCYQPTNTFVKEGITPSYWANIFNIYGFLIDPLVGSMWKYDSQTQVTAVKKEKCG